MPLTKSMQVVAGQRVVVVEPAVGVLGRGPSFPAVGLVEDVGVGLAVKLGLVGAVLFQVVEVFQEQQPRRLLGVVELGRAAGLLPENVVDVLEGLLKHSHAPLYSRSATLARPSWGANASWLPVPIDATGKAVMANPQ